MKIKDSMRFANFERSHHLSSVKKDTCRYNDNLISQTSLFKLTSARYLNDLSFPVSLETKSLKKEEKKATLKFRFMNNTPTKVEI